MDAERKDKEALEAKLLAMESKLLTSGGENVLDKVSGQNDLCVCVAFGEEHGVGAFGGAARGEQ